MIPVHHQKQFSERYNSMYASHLNSQQQLYHHHRQQQYPSPWTYVQSSLATPNSLSLHGRYPYPSALNILSRPVPRITATPPSTNSFMAISPSTPPQLPTSTNPTSRVKAAALPRHFPPWTAASSFPDASSSSSAVPVASLNKGTQKEEYEAAEVLLGLTTREEKDEEEESTSQHSVRKSSVGSVTSSLKKKSTLGHVTDESSIGTTSPTPPMACPEDPSNWYSGTISLSLPEDDDVLSPLHCFMRKYCVETFSATEADVATPRYGKSHGFKVEVGQVGIRCVYCKDLPVGKRPERAVCYPSSLRNIYHSIETWQRRHSLVCTHISPWVRKSIEELMESSKTRAGGRRQYWEDSAKRLGMVDTSRGVRFIRPPGDLGPLQEPDSPEASSSKEIPNGGRPVVLQEDKELVTDYLYLLMEQMQTCFFTEEDRTGGRSKIKDISLNFPGYECRHCHGRAGFGRYFPTSVAALSLANSDRNVFNHLQKCRRCPNQIKKELIRLSNDQGQSKNRRGLRKLFFGRIWDRMHTTPPEGSSGSIPSLPKKGA
ncbi:hypothetical protein IV203_007009 [Nitzschia inconspicua]|uniref:Uncharacterized protein n=1 Tax=Nitzschia inconspicua TaxID=303405 RepID=A0A9K3KEA2_9STRA|nr:hypothetical protein IV203_007009 [Nitzschia inconspicua]